MLSLKIIAENFLDRFSKEKSRRTLEEILEFLGPASIHVNPVDKKKRVAAENKASPQDLSEEGITRLHEKLDAEHKRKVKTRDAWNKAFNESLSPHILDAGTTDSGESALKEDIWRMLFNTLSKRLGKDLAVQYIDDLCSFFLQHLDIHVRNISGHKEPGKYIDKKPTGILHATGDNKAALRDPGVEFIGEIVGRNPTFPFNYDVKISGPGVSPETCRLDTSASLLRLHKGHKYRLESTSYEEKSHSIRVLIPEAERRGTHSMILKDQIFAMANNVVKDFLETDYKDSIDKMGVNIKDTETEIKKLESKIQDLPEDDTQIDKLMDQRDKLLARLEEYSKMGVPELKGVKDTFMERIKHPLYKKMLRHPMTYRDWEGEHPPTVDLMDVQIGPDDAERLLKDLSESLTSMHGVSQEGLPYKDLAPLMLDSIQEVPDPTQKSGWQAKFFNKIKDLAKEKKIDLPGTVDSNRVVPGIISDIRKVVLQDPKFRHLKENLTRHLMRAIKADSEHVEDVKKALDDLWGHVGLQNMLSKISAEYGRFPQMLKAKTLTLPEYRKHVEDATVEHLRKYITGAGDPVMESHILPVMDIVVAIGKGLGEKDPLLQKLQRLILLEIWHFEALKTPAGGSERRSWKLEEKIPESLKPDKKNPRQEEQDDGQEVDTERLGQKIEMYKKFKRLFHIEGPNTDIGLKIYNELKTLLLKRKKWEDTQEPKKKRRRIPDLEEVDVGGQSELRNILHERHPETQKLLDIF